MPIRLEPARPEDFPAVAALLEKNKLPVDGLRECFSTAVVACERDQMVGSAAVELYGPAALLRSVAVEERLRNRGLGRTLAKAALDLARRHQAVTAYLLTETAPDFFSRFFGFQPIARVDVAAVVQQSIEFKTACPDTAKAMVLSLLALEETPITLRASEKAAV